MFCPPSKQVQEFLCSNYFDNYDLPAPVRIQIGRPDGAVEEVVLRKTRHGSVKKEAMAFAILHDFGLPVPSVILQPRIVDDREIMLTSVLEGINLQKLSMSSNEGLERAKNLLMQAIDQLIDVSDPIKAHPKAKGIETKTLKDELEVIETHDSGWVRNGIFSHAYEQISRIAADMKDQKFAFFGDLQPGNFLSDGVRITGFLDFENAAFGDILLGLAKYKTHDLHPLNKAGVVEEYLARHHIQDSVFAVRVAIWCLRTLDREAPAGVGNEKPRGYRKHLLTLLDNAMQNALW